MTRIIGVDPSLTGTGLAILDPGAPPITDVIKIPVPKGATLAQRADRIASLTRFVVRCAAAVPTELAVVEGPSYGSAAAQSGHHERGGLWWSLIAGLLAADVPVAVVPPSCRAMYATGKGNASKDAVVMAVARRWPDVVLDSNDAADALVLAALGARYLGRPIDNLPQTHLVGLKGVAWPELVSDDGEPGAEVGAA